MPEEVKQAQAEHEARIAKEGNDNASDFINKHTVMSDKLKNLIVRAVTGVFFVTVMVLGILHPHALIALFALITGSFHLGIHWIGEQYQRSKGKPLYLQP